jgi:metallo-beta-lactamase family protein
MLGSSSVILDIEDDKTAGNVRVVFSGDIGRPGIPIIRDPAHISDGTDVLIIESTYGDRLHPPYPESEMELRRIINETVKKGGALLIPAFSVGRTQQIVFAMHKLYNEKQIPEIPIYVDSPLASRATEVFRLHPETYDIEIREFLLEDADNNPFGFPTLHYTNTVQDSKNLNKLSGPAVIISASGMMEGGRILHHLRNRISDPRNTILITGWQAPYTLGRRIFERQPEVNILGESFKVKAGIEVLTGLSAHADREGLLEWAGAMSRKPSRTFVVHGEDKAAKAFSKSLKSECGFEQVDVPAMKESFTI